MKHKAKNINPNPTPTPIQSAGAGMSMDQAKNILQILPVAALISSIETMIGILKKRGVEIRDWDNKGRTLEQIRMIGGKVYFLAAENEQKKE